MDTNTRSAHISQSTGRFNHEPSLPPPDDAVAILVNSTPHSTSLFSGLQPRAHQALRRLSPYLPLAGITAGMSSVVAGTVMCAIDKKYELASMGMMGVGAVTMLGSAITMQAKIFAHSIQTSIHDQITLVARAQNEQATVSDPLAYLQLGMTEQCLRDAVDLVTMEDEQQAHNIELNNAEVVAIANQLRQLALSGMEQLPTEMRHHVETAQNNPVNLVSSLLQALRESKSNEPLPYPAILTNSEERQQDHHGQA